jgi:hypothetical protein
MKMHQEYRVVCNYFQYEQMLATGLHLEDVLPVYQSLSPKNLPGLAIHRVTTVVEVIDPDNPDIVSATSAKTTA